MGEKPAPATGPQVSSQPPIRTVRLPPRPTPAARDPPPTTAPMTRKPLVTKLDAKHARKPPRSLLSAKPAPVPELKNTMMTAPMVINAAPALSHQANASDHD